MLTDLTCPAEVFRTILPTEDIPAVTLTLYNLSDRVIASVEVTVRMLSAAGAEKERMTFRGRTLNGRPHSTFPMNVPMAPAPGVRKADVTIEKVWYADKDTWQRQEENLTEYEPNDLPASTALTRLKYTAGENAVGYPSQQEGLWVCVCGRPNPDLFSVCARCRREKALVFTMFNREAVENQVAMREKQLDLNTRSAREDTARLQRIREEEYNQNRARRKHRVFLASCLFACLLLTALLLGGVVPTLRVIQAERAMQRSDYTGALKTLNAYPDFPGAQEKIKECLWQIAAKEASDSRDPETIAAAAELLRSDSRQGSSAEADRAEIRLARILLDAGDLDGAREAIANLPEDSADRKSLEAECRYREACNLLDERKYEDARKIFVSLGSYPNAATMASECVWREANAAMEQKDYAGAIELYNQILGYAESRARMQECHFRIAEGYELEDNFAAAAEEYKLADTWDIARQKLWEMIDYQAEAAIREGDWEEAKRLYNTVPEYEGAQKGNLTCAYMLGFKAFAASDFPAAYAYLSELPKGWEPENAEQDAAETIADLRTQAAYHAGCAARAAGDNDTAEDYLAKASDYRDAKDILAQIAAEKEEAARAAQPTATPEPETTPEPSPEPTPTPTPTPAPTVPPAPTDENPDAFLVKPEDGDE